MQNLITSYIFDKQIKLEINITLKLKKENKTWIA